MKNKILLGLLAVVIMAAAFAFTPSKQASLERAGLVSAENVVAQYEEPGGIRTIFADGAEMFAAPGSIYYEYTWPLDTITNAANDTLTIPGTAAISKMYSDFEYNYSIIRTNISGTTNLALKLEQTNWESGNTAWATLASGAATTATIEYLIGDCTAVRLRYIVDGTGTQSSSYRLRAVFKKKT